MNKLDVVIANISYLLDVLRSYKEIIKSGNCNTCDDKLTCDYKPKVGQLVRYNCPFYVEE